MCSSLLEDFFKIIWSTCYLIAWCEIARSLRNKLYYLVYLTHHIFNFHKLINSTVIVVI